MKVKIWLVMNGLALAACAPTVGPTSTSTGETSSSLSIETTTSTGANTTMATSTTTIGGSSSTTSGSTATTLKGEPVDLGPPNGASLGVIGVQFDDLLNVRSGPGADQQIVATVPPIYDGLVAQGETRRLPAFWTKVEYQGTLGWVNMSYLAYIGRTDDVTAQTIDHFGERPEASTMTELGQLVAEAAASADPPSDIVVVIEESSGDLGEVTFDVVGLGDDSLRGVRLHVFGERLDDMWQLRTVEQTSLCDPTRGMDADGTCA